MCFVGLSQSPKNSIVRWLNPSFTDRKPLCEQREIPAKYLAMRDFEDPVLPPARLLYQRSKFRSEALLFSCPPHQFTPNLAA